MRLLLLTWMLLASCECGTRLRNFDDLKGDTAEAEAAPNGTVPWEGQVGASGGGGGEESDAGFDAGTDVDAGWTPDAGPTPENCIFTYQWGSRGDDRVMSVAVAPNGDIYAGGVFKGTIDFGNGPVTSVNDDGFIVMVPANGGALRSFTFGSPAADGVNKIKISNDGTVVVAASIGALAGKFGTIPISVQGAADGLLAKLEPDLTPRWAVTVGGAGLNAQGEGVTGLALLPNDDIVISGAFSDAFKVGPHLPPLTVHGQGDIFIAKFASTGHALLAQSYGGFGTEVGVDVAADAKGEVTLVAMSFAIPPFPTGLSLGGSNLSGPGRNDIFVGHYNSNLNHLWSVAMGGPGDDWPWAIAASPSGQIFLTGHFNETIQLNGTSLKSAGGEDIFLISLDAANGKTLWARRFGGATVDKGRGVAVDRDGSVWATSFFTNNVDFDGTPLQTTGGADLGLVHYDSQGRQLSVSSITGRGSWNESYALTTGACGPIMAGYFKETVQFKPRPLTAYGNEDAFITSVGR